MPTSRDRTLGQQGEDIAAAELIRRGYAILARGYRTRHGEIDIVAREGEVLAFVEVKTRTTHAYGGALAAVTPAKQQRVIRMALDYLVRHRAPRVPCRFDVVGILMGEHGPEIELVRDAFSARAC